MNTVRDALSLVGFVNKPKIFIVGFQKCGTTALYHYLAQHQLVHPPYTKEPNYFCYEKNHTLVGKAKYLRNYPRRLKYSKYLTFDASPDYIYYPDGIREIELFSPNIKYIVLIRDPVLRAKSAYNHWFQETKKGLDPVKIYFKNQGMSLNTIEQIDDYWDNKNNCLLSFAKIVEIENNYLKNRNQLKIEFGIYTKGLYGYFIKKMLNIVDRNKIHLVSSSSLKNNTKSELRKIAKFLEISDTGFQKKEISAQQAHVRPKTSNTDVDEEWLRSLYYESDNLLEELTGFEIPWRK